MNEMDPIRLSLAAYLAGALPAAERGSVEAHLAGCAGCREELARLSPLPPLIGRLRAEDLQGASPAAPAPLRERTLQTLAQSRRRDRRRTWQLAAGGALLGAAASALAVALLVAPGPAGQPLRLTDTASVTTSVAGRVAAAGKPWGTQLHLDLRGLPASSSYTAWVVADDGRSWPAATWGPTALHRADVTGAAPVALAALARVEVRDAHGITLAVATPAPPAG